MGRILIKNNLNCTEQYVKLFLFHYRIFESKTLIGAAFLSLFHTQRIIKDLSKFTFQLLIKMS